MDAALTGGAAPEEDVYSWLLASADQMMYPLLDPNPLDAEALGPGGRSRGSSISGAVIGMGSPDKALLAGAAAGAGSAIAASSAATRKASAGTSSKTKVKTEAGGGRKGGGGGGAKTTGRKRGASGAGRGGNKKAKQTRADVLERNRRSARECRKRKKERVAELEARLKRLEQENMQLRVQLRIGRETDEKETAEKWRITNLLGEMIKRGESDDTISETIHMFTERYADYGKERRVACRYHLDYLEKLLVPTQVSVSLCLCLCLCVCLSICLSFCLSRDASRKWCPWSRCLDFAAAAAVVFFGAPAPSPLYLRAP